MIVVLSGLVAGSIHVVSGPDHLVAMAPIAVDDSKRAARVGAIWGLGHGIGVALVAGMGMAARSVVDVQVMSAWSEFLVGIALVALGVWAIHKATKVTIHRHGHEHDHAEAELHEHYHVHVGGEHNAEAHQGHSHLALGVGMLHGATGTGHVLCVLPALALPPSAAVAYVVAYLSAAVLSMAVFAGILSRFLQRAGATGLRRVMMGSGVFALALGVVWSVNGWPFTS